MSKKEDFIYTGVDNLEAMIEAKNYNAFLVSLIKKQLKGKQSRILDFGAGTGTYAEMLEKQEGITPDCLEPDASLKEGLKSRGFKVFTDIEKVPSNTYDLIYALNVFEHIEDDFNEITKLKRVLKKGGRIVVYVPAYQVLFSDMDKQVGHYRRYRLNRLSNLAEKAKLKKREVVYYEPIGFLAALVYKGFRGKGVLSPKSIRTYDRYAFPISKTLQPLFRKFFGKNAILVAEK